MTDLTQEQRRLLEDCPRERIEKFLSYNSNWPTLVVWASDDSNYCMPTSSTGGAYIPRAAVEAWLAEQDEREAEKQPTYGPPPPEVKRAQREAQEDHFRDATEKVEGPWKAIRSEKRWSVMHKDNIARCLCGASWFTNTDGAPYTEPEARALAEAEAARLNAKWLEEQEAKLLEPFEEHGCRITNSWSSITRTRYWYIRHIETGLRQAYLQPDTQSVQDARENVIAAASILSGRLEREKQEQEAERMSDEISSELLGALEAAVERQGFSNTELIAARAIIAKAKGVTP